MVYENKMNFVFTKLSHKFVKNRIYFYTVFIKRVFKALYIGRNAQKKHEKFFENISKKLLEF